MPQKTTNVLITGVGGGSVGHQILHALLLAGGDYRIICCDANPYSFGLYQVRDRYVVPMAKSPDYIKAILTIIENEKIDVLLPGSEVEIRVLAPATGQLKASGCTLIVSPPDVIKLCSDKGDLYKWLAKNSIGVPESADINSWQALVKKTGFPIIAKPAGASGGSRNVAILGNEDEVQHYIAHFPGPKESIVFQEYVGDAGTEYTVGVLIGRDGLVIDSFVLHRYLTGLSLGVERIIGGKTYALSTGCSQGFVVKHKKIQQFCEELSVRMGMRGPVNIQLRLHEGEVKVFEVHPRFSGTTSIRGDAGFNEPDILIRNFVHGEKFSRQDYKTDVAAIRAFEAIIVPRAELLNIKTLP